MSAIATRRVSRFAFRLVCRLAPAASFAWIVALGAAPCAQATLGSDAGSISTDVATLGASAQPVSAALASGVTRHTLTLPSGTVVHEYVSAAGRVFAVAWQGPMLPPLKQLLGTTHFTHYTQAVNAAQTSGTMRRHTNVVLDDLVVMSAGHMGAFSGAAYLRSAMPAGFSMNDIQ
ncbi:DUF2844 domain-containing protein [Pararobbsia silviterrae]|uniref:DUF2844 domain-containing protein n=1 Tax=Pararobbsia silviterrae TaxID=1792498 RepID=A0A494X2X1_9BURK|nr:DUF2844 domain-containing protein [Pararobbsia silviterrae]RKP45045.1 DUF2844 domain-containing protein [Pararobbsia silviterrae]